MVRAMPPQPRSLRATASSLRRTLGVWYQAGGEKAAVPAQLQIPVIASAGPAPTYDDDDDDYDNADPSYIKTSLLISSLFRFYEIL